MVLHEIKDRTWKIVLIVFFIIIFCLLLTTFYEKVGNQIFIFYFIPVGLTAFFFGLWPAIIMQTTLIFWGSTLLSFMLKVPVIEFFWKVLCSNPIGIISHYCLIALLGYMRDQHLTIKRLNHEIIRISRIDELTSLYNRRAILEEANQELLQTIRNQDDVSFYIDSSSSHKEALAHANPGNGMFKSKRELTEYVGIFTCALFDIDHFKRVNDSYGHLMGDKVLQEIGNILKEGHNLRKSDICGRYGGEEFLILFPGTSARNAIYVLDRITEKIKTAEFSTKEGNIFSITISTGISQFKKGDQDITDIIHRADIALYYAKHHGRNQTIVYEETF